MRREHIVAAKFATAGALMASALAIPERAEATGPCQSQFESDELTCSNQRTECFADPNYSFWTGTCNLQYGGCILAANDLLLICLVESSLS